MERIFETHRIRKSRPCFPLWRFTTPDEGGLAGTEKMPVPGVWESHPSLRNYRGRGVYEQKITAAGNLRIWLGGVSFQAGVFLDNIPLATHYGAYTGFEAIAMNLREGEHTLRIEADNRFGDHSALHIPNDYYSYGGIHRPVLMETVGDVYLLWSHATPRRKGEEWFLDVRVCVRCLADHARDADVAVVMDGLEARKRLRVPGKKTETIVLSLACGQRNAWSPDTPALYELQTLLYLDGKPVDDLIDRIGFREILVEGNRLLLNGHPLRLLGFNRHEEDGSCGLAVPLESMIRDLQLVRDMGANCVRTCHYPNDPRFLDLCDELGILVWEESHVRGFSEERMRHPLFMEQLSQCTREMVTQHWNHPSIILWGSLNECADDTEYGVRCYQEIMNLLREMDGSRPVTAALLSRGGGRAYDAFDVVSVNMYPLWYHNTPVSQAIDHKKQEIRKQGAGGKPLIISEIGAGAIYGCHDPLGESKWSEERQCAILEKQIRGVLADPEITGLFLWQFADVRVDEEWFYSRPKSMNNKGIVDEFRRPKMAYQTVKRLFKEASTAAAENTGCLEGRSD